MAYQKLAAHIAPSSHASFCEILRPPRVPSAGLINNPGDASGVRGAPNRGRRGRAPGSMRNYRIAPARLSPLILRSIDPQTVNDINAHTAERLISFEAFFSLCRIYIAFYLVKYDIIQPTLRPPSSTYVYRARHQEVGRLNLCIEENVMPLVVGVTTLAQAVVTAVASRLRPARCQLES
ncbi:hypothetical protein EVAR_58900_1 [Eumeta japonica]|uniref:Uncharacterized protein n=1 Tax=Eumeta variegata TaxID=151549 RepID=A0A4C1Z0B4_EUMVA|nr:hypothetical protein EVAR_58900_1 [Eumeta japonica]